MEPSILIILGSPPSGWQRDIFEKYQESRNAGDEDKDGDWADFEKKATHKLLFSSEGEELSTIDELFCRLFDAPVKIVDYYYSIGRHRNLWVATVNIPISGVLCGAGSDITWPPSQEITRQVSLSLSYILTREWVEVISTFPE